MSKKKQPSKSRNTVTPLLPMTAEIASAFERGICLRLIMGHPGFSSSVDSDEISAGDADTDMLHVSKETLDCDAFTALRRFHGEIRNYLKLRSMPIKTRLFRGTYFIGLTIADTVFEAMKGFVAKHDEELVPALLKEYETAKQEAKRRLKHLYDEADYPTPARLKQACYIQWFPLATQTDGKVQDIDATLFQDAQRRLQDTYAQAAMEMRTGLRRVLLELTQHLHEQLSGTKEDGKPKILTASAVTHVHEYLEFFNPKDVTNDTELRQMVTRMQQLMSGVTVEDLRKDEAFRARMGQSLAGITKELDKLVVTGGRKITVRRSA